LKYKDNGLLSKQY